MRRRSGTIVSCGRCGEKVYIHPSQLKYFKNHFCSSICYWEWRRGRGRSEEKPLGRLVSCEECGKRVYKKPYQLKGLRKYFCSRDCCKKYRLLNPSHWKKKPRKVKRICEQCGNEFEEYQCWVKRGRGRFCSKECYSLGGRGENSSAWRGGIAFEPYSFEFNKELKKQIKERDNYTCQICGSKENLCVHHIDYDKKNSEQENLIVLCVSCNSKVNSQRAFWTGYFMGRIIGRWRQF